MLRGCHWAEALLVAALICGTSHSRAEVAPLQLDYDADSVCPDRSTFAELVAQRVAAARAEGVVAAPARTEVRLLADGADPSRASNLPSKTRKHWFFGCLQLLARVLPVSKCAFRDRSPKLKR
jgi:hypothetical protein